MPRGGSSSVWPRSKSDRGEPEKWSPVATRTCSTATLEGFDRVFLDASFLVAVYGIQDANHARAVELLGKADCSQAHLCTIWDCFGEALTLLLRHFGYRSASALADSRDDFVFLPYDTSHRLEALSVFRRRSENRKGLSFVDALAYVVIRRELAGAPALSFDRDFAALGLTVVR